MFKKSKKTKRKIVFILCCLLYIVSFLLLGIIMGNPMLAIIPMCIFSVIAIWQLKLEEEKNNRYVLIMLGVNLFLACISMGIRAFISGDPHAVTTFITILVSLALMVALPILIVFGIAARNKIKPDEPFIQAKNYTQKEQERQKKKSYGVAKRAVFASNLSYISLVQLMTSLLLFILVYMSISAITYFEEKPMSSLFMNGGVFLFISIACLVIFAVTGIWGAIGYKRLEIICIHLGFELKGAREVNEMAQRANFANQVTKSAGLPPTQGIGILSSVENVIRSYLFQNGQTVCSPKKFKLTSKLLVTVQLGIAVYLVITTVL